MLVSPCDTSGSVTCGPVLDLYENDGEEDKKYEKLSI